MRVKDVMSSPAVTIGEDAPIAEAIRVLLGARVSGLPVVDATGRVTGVVSEGDFLRRPELGTEASRPHWMEWLLSPGRLALDYTHANGRKVGEVMTRDACTIGEDAALAEAVNLMQKRNVKRLPVVKDGKISGIVTRADLVRTLSTFIAPAYEDALSTDAEIRAALMAELGSQTWAPAACVTIDVKDGIVTMSGPISDNRQRDAIKVAAENVTGVKGIRDELVWFEPLTGTIVSPF